MEPLRSPRSDGPRPLVVHNHAYPGGVAYFPPNVDSPYWRTAGGERTDFQTVVAGADDETRAWIGELHAAAVHRIAAHAMTRLGDGDGTARRLLGAAARLLREPLNGFPAWSVRH